MTLGGLAQIGDRLKNHGRPLNFFFINTYKKAKSER